MKSFPEIITYEDVLEAMLFSLNKPEHLIMFPLYLQAHFSALGITAVSDQSSTIRALLEGLAVGTAKELTLRLRERRSQDSRDLGTPRLLRLSRGSYALPDQPDQVLT